jgi:hypothetical protein
MWGEDRGGLCTRKRIEERQKSESGDAEEVKRGSGSEGGEEGGD